jgi:Flp pilus assembly protein TadD
MRNNFKGILASIVVTGLLAGCSTSGISTHSNAVDHAGTDREQVRNHERNTRSLLKPKSDHVSLKGDQSKSFLAAGKEHFANQNFGLAEKNFRKAVETRSDNASAWLGLAASLDHLGRFEFSDRAYKQLVQLKSNNARVLNNMGYSYLLRGDYQKARSYLNRAQRINPHLEEIQGNIHLLEKTVRG